MTYADRSSGLTARHWQTLAVTAALAALVTLAVWLELIGRSDGYLEYLDVRGAMSAVIWIFVGAFALTSTLFARLLRTRSAWMRVTLYVAAAGVAAGTVALVNWVTPF